MKLLHIAFLAIAASLVTSTGYSQVSVRARLGTSAPPPVAYQSSYPASHDPFYQKSQVVIVDRGYGHGYSRRERRRWERHERFERRHHRGYRHDGRNSDHDRRNYH